MVPPPVHGPVGGAQATALFKFLLHRRYHWLIGGVACRYIFASNKFSVVMFTNSAFSVKKPRHSQAQPTLPHARLRISWS